MRLRRGEAVPTPIQAAANELMGTILQRYPTVTFEISRAADEPGTYHLIAVVDVDDTDQVLDLVIDRVVELQVDEHIPVHVIPIRTPERVLAEVEARIASTLAGRSGTA